MMRRGVVFTLDAILAGILLVGGLMLIASISEHDADTSQLESAGHDVMIAMSAISIDEFNDPWIAARIADGTIDDPNVTALEQIGYFWAAGDTASAEQLAAILLNDSYPEFGLRLSAGNVTVYERPSIKGGNDIIVASRMVSGIAQGEALTGSSAVAYLRRIDGKRNALFLPVGGFVGEGNITVSTSQLPLDANVTNIVLELGAARDFEFLINNNSCAHFVPNGSQLIPSRWEVSNCSSMVNPGDDNTFSFMFESLENASLAGGYLKINYVTDELHEQNISDALYHFPSIRGLINLYDGMYVGGNVTGIEVTLHFFSNYSSYLTLGNASFSFPGSNVTQNITLNATQVEAALVTAGMTYADLSRKTVPLRFGIGDVVISGVPADIVVVSDTSGSMGWCITNDQPPPCSSGDVTKISSARSVTRNFVQRMLNGSSGTHVGLSEFASSIKSWHNLSNDTAPLTAQINSYASSGGTCICCGINNATAILNAGGQAILIPRGTAGWKYNDSDLASPPANWRMLSFNDANWRNGSTGIGWWYSVNTLIANRYEGDYFYRRKFNVDDASDIVSAQLLVADDDGAEVYLNGNLIDDDYPSTHGANYWNRNRAVDKDYFVSGENIIAVRQWHRGNPNRMYFDLELIANTRGNITGTQAKSIVIMSDGEATDTCALQGTGNPTNDAIKAACDAYTNYGIVVYTVGFGLGADAAAMSAMANCTTGEYFAAGNQSALQEAFENIGTTIVRRSSTQDSIIEGNFTHTILYPDSTIRVNYNPDLSPPQQNELSVTLQSPPLANCSGSVMLYEGMRFLDARVTSYSGEYWTRDVRVNGVNIYNLTPYSSFYSGLGDPFEIHIPPALLTAGNNTVVMGIAIDPTNNSVSCSANNTLIYTAAINLSTERSHVVANMAGCVWRVMFADGSVSVLSIPAVYNGTNSCSYQPDNVTYDASDAYQLGAYTIFNRLDFRKEQKLFVNLRDEDLEVIVTTISRVPYMWGPAVMKLEVTR